MYDETRILVLSLLHECLTYIILGDVNYYRPARTIQGNKPETFADDLLSILVSFALRSHYSSFILPW